MAVIRPNKRRTRDQLQTTTTTTTKTKTTTPITENVLPPPPKRPKYKQHTLHTFFGSKKQHDTIQQQRHIQQDQAALHALLVPTPALDRDPVDTPALVPTTIPAQPPAPDQTTTQATSTAQVPAPLPAPALAPVQARTRSPVTVHVPVRATTPAPDQATNQATVTAQVPAPFRAPDTALDQATSRPPGIVQDPILVPILAQPPALDQAPTPALATDQAPAPAPALDQVTTQSPTTVQVPVLATNPAQLLTIDQATIQATGTAQVPAPLPSPASAPAPVQATTRSPAIVQVPLPATNPAQPPATDQAPNQAFGTAQVPAPPPAPDPAPLLPPDPNPMEAIARQAMRQVFTSIIAESRRADTNDPQAWALKQYEELAQIMRTAANVSASEDGPRPCPSNLRDHLPAAPLRLVIQALLDPLDPGTQHQSPPPPTTATADDDQLINMEDDPWEPTQQDMPDTEQETTPCNAPTLPPSPSANPPATKRPVPTNNSPRRTRQRADADEEVIDTSPNQQPTPPIDPDPPPDPPPTPPTDPDPPPTAATTCPTTKRPGPTRHPTKRSRPPSRQTTITGEAAATGDEESERRKAEKARLFQIPFGEMTKDKPDSYARLCFGNMGPAGLQPQQESSVEELRHFLREWEVDHFGGVEHQVNATNLDHRYRLPAIFQSENALRCHSAHNVNENNHSTRQQGGTMALTLGAMASRVHSQGEDSTGLGRWVWQLFKGKNNIATRIYTAYRPCKSAAHQVNTVYAQHRRYFRGKGDERCPRELFLIDLEKELHGRKLAGERLVVMMDANDDVSKGTSTGYLLQSA